jgi:hypothetical protein
LITRCFEPDSIDLIKPLAVDEPEDDDDDEDGDIDILLFLQQYLCNIAI